MYWRSHLRWGAVVSVQSVLSFFNWGKRKKGEGGGIVDFPFDFFRFFWSSPGKEGKGERGEKEEQVEVLFRDHSKYYCL